MTVVRLLRSRPRPALPQTTPSHTLPARICQAPAPATEKCAGVFAGAVTPRRLMGLLEGPLRLALTARRPPSAARPERGGGGTRRPAGPRRGTAPLWAPGPHCDGQCAPIPCSREAAPRLSLRPRGSQRRRPAAADRPACLSGGRAGAPSTSPARPSSARAGS